MESLHRSPTPLKSSTASISQLSRTVIMNSAIVAWACVLFLSQLLAEATVTRLIQDTPEDCTVDSPFSLAGANFGFTGQPSAWRISMWIKTTEFAPADATAMMLLGLPLKGTFFTDMNDPAGWMFFALAKQSQGPLGLFATGWTHPTYMNGMAPSSVVLNTNTASIQVPGTSVTTGTVQPI